MRLKHEETEKLTRNKIESKKSPEGFTAKFYQTFKVKLTQIL
jgi:hypothetical protein